MVSKLKRYIVLSMALFVFLGASLDVLWSQSKETASSQKLKIPPGKLKLKFRTDLRVDVIHSSRCKCDLGDVDALYMANIMVDVSNHKAGSVGTATESVLTVTYFDLNLGRKVTVTKNLPVMNPYPKNPWVHQRVVIVNIPVLLKRSVGITASIRPKNNNVSDPIVANNKMTVRKCNMMVY